MCRSNCAVRVKCVARVVSLSTPPVSHTEVATFCGRNLFAKQSLLSLENELLHNSMIV